MRELLIRYLLGELDGNEQEDLHRRLAASPELRRELAHLRSCFADACQADETPTEMPYGLAERTTEWVAGAEGDEGSEFARSRAAALAATADPPAGALGWSLADLTVAGGVVLAVSMLLFPALRNSRDETRRNVCQNNQRQLWLVVSDYAQDHGGYVPPVQPYENAGIFTVKLVERGYISAEDLALLLVCPAAPLADSIRAGKYAIRIPTSTQLRAMSASELAVARRNMSPFFAYRFPYRVGQQYHQIRAERRTSSPLFSDAPGSEQDGMMSPNHDGSIVQVMNMDGSIKSLTSSTVPGVEDDLFRNVLGKVAAGVGRQDSVLGKSEASPGMASIEFSR
jgi:hypothetical protein